MHVFTAQPPAVLVAAAVVAGFSVVVVVAGIWVVVVVVAGFSVVVAVGTTTLDLHSDPYLPLPEPLMLSVPSGQASTHEPSERYLNLPHLVHTWPLMEAPAAVKGQMWQFLSGHLHFLRVCAATVSVILPPLQVKGSRLHAVRSEVG